MTESESVALPLGDAALTGDIITDSAALVNRYLQKNSDYSIFFAFGTLQGVVFVL